ncbi:MAG: hypothetical protein HY365_03555 [Candidatus Aenigmarchaeota archaeon]|nr:hypothetical protein [Candidatus Aenigmarchaeota archaeon]
MASQFLSARETVELSAAAAGALIYSNAEAAIAAALSGKRVLFLPPSVEPDVFYRMAFMRLPVVSVIYSSSFHMSQPNHGPFLSLLDSGCVLLSVESNQELSDLIIIAHALAESRQVMLPVVIQYDMPYMTEPVVIPGEKSVAPLLKAGNPYRLDIKKPAAYGVPVEEGYGTMALQQSKALNNASAVLAALSESWHAKFRRKYPPVDAYKTEDADVVAVMIGMHSATARKAADAEREKNVKAGVARLRTLRPFPVKEYSETVKSARTASIEMSPAFGRGILQRETCSASCFSVMKHPSEKDFTAVFEAAVKGSLKSWVLE